MRDDDGFVARRSPHVSADQLRGDGNTWQETLAICELAGTFTIRSYYSNRQGRKAWDEPPSGASRVLAASDEMRQEAKLMLRELQWRSGRTKKDKKGGKGLFRKNKSEETELGTADRRDDFSGVGGGSQRHLGVENGKTKQSTRTGSARGPFPPRRGRDLETTGATSQRDTRHRTSKPNNSNETSPVSPKKPRSLKRAESPLPPSNRRARSRTRLSSKRNLRSSRSRSSNRSGESTPIRQKKTYSHNQERSNSDFYNQEFSVPLSNRRARSRTRSPPRSPQQQKQALRNPRSRSSSRSGESTPTQQKRMHNLNHERSDSGFSSQEFSVSLSGRRTRSRSRSPPKQELYGSRSRPRSRSRELPSMEQKEVRNLDQEWGDDSGLGLDDGSVVHHEVAFTEEEALALALKLSLQELEGAKPKRERHDPKTEEKKAREEKTPPKAAPREVGTKSSALRMTEKEHLEEAIKLSMQQEQPQTKPIPAPSASSTSSHSKDSKRDQSHNDGVKPRPKAEKLQTSSSKKRGPKRVNLSTMTEEEQIQAAIKRSMRLELKKKDSRASLKDDGKDQPSMAEGSQTRSASRQTRHETNHPETSVPKNVDERPGLPRPNHGKKQDSAKPLSEKELSKLSEAEQIRVAILQSKQTEQAEARPKKTPNRQKLESMTEEEQIRLALHESMKDSSISLV